MRRNLLVFLAFCIMLIAVGVVFKTPILQSFSNFLIKQDVPEEADAMVVLSGNAFDRGNEGARLYRDGYARRVICPGGNLERAFLIMGDTVYESELLKKNIVRNGVPDSMITLLRYGTSTAEEADTLLGYCRAHQVKKLLVVTSLFHTRRAGKVYRKKFAGTDIKIIMRGAHDSQFDENYWWKDEYGLIALNNEYMKTFYYFLKGR
ncbi:MAG: YdcF family protein [Bacteroidetes bacterium]|nr:YdcF family protein [Bacteroidota bacterium]